MTQMTAAAVRHNVNPILTGLLLGVTNSSFVGEMLFQRLPQALRGMTLGRTGDERMRSYDLRRAPGAATRRVNIKYDGVVYTVDQSAVEVPIPRELIQEQEAARRMNVGGNLDISQIAMTTASEILALDYELEAATLATTAGTYASGHTVTLSAGTKWSHADGKPVTGIETASDLIRKKIGRKPNALTLSADGYSALRHNAQIKTYLPNTQMGPPTDEQLRIILGLEYLEVGEAVWKKEDDTVEDVWGNHAILSYRHRMAGDGAVSLAEPAFGFTSALEGHPFAEQPYFDNNSKTWVYGATYERKPNIGNNEAGYLFINPK